MYAVLDIETTGGQYNEEGITEIAIYKFDGEKVVDQFISLVNPEIDIQPFVVKLTGINNAMLRSAPKFFEIAKRIIEITTDCVIVAHNAEFDYRVLRMEFKRLGYDFKRQSLCTVELSQKLLPEQTSYSLGKLVRSLGIPIPDRHRAYGDAIATLKLFKLLLAKDLQKQILTSMIKSNIAVGLSPKLLDIVEELPNAVGIYYIHNEEGNIIYIGKSTNIKKKIHQHFTSNSPVFKKIQNETYTVTFEKTGTELIAILKEIEEIYFNTPCYNKKKKKSVFPYSLYLKTNSSGYLYCNIEKTDGRRKNTMAFNSPTEATKFVNLLKGQKLCAIFADGFYLDKDKNVSSEAFSSAITETAEEYNSKIIQLLEPYNIDQAHLLIVDKGRKVDEKSAVYIENGILQGYCYFDLNFQISQIEKVKTLLTPIAYQRNNRNVILNYIYKRKGFRIIHL